MLSFKPLLGRLMGRSDSKTHPTTPAPVALDEEAEDSAPLVLTSLEPEDAVPAAAAEPLAAPTPMPATESPAAPAAQALSVESSGTADDWAELELETGLASGTDDQDGPEISMRLLDEAEADDAASQALPLDVDAVRQVSPAETPAPAVHAASEAAIEPEAAAKKPRKAPKRKTPAAPKKPVVDASAPEAATPKRARRGVSLRGPWPISLEELDAAQARVKMPVDAYAVD